MSAERPRPRVSRWLALYALALFILTLGVALFAEYPFSMIGWGVAAVSFLFLAAFVIVPLLRG